MAQQGKGGIGGWVVFWLLGIIILAYLGGKGYASR